jgi:hypothetical protein
VSYVYLISAGERGPVKVGVSNRPEARLMELQSGNHLKLHIAAKWQMPDRNSAFAIERAVLDEMKPYRMVGEWVDADEFGMKALIHYDHVLPRLSA